MTITPNSKLWLLKDVDLDPNYNYTMDFDSLTAQENYFNSKIYSEFDKNEGYSYIRDNRAIKVEMPIDKLFGINYLMFENEETNKRYYAFITSKEWLRSDATAITIKIDPLQSFMFDYELEESFIEREHQDRFTSELKPIYSLTEENLEIGENYVVKDTKQIEDSDYPKIIWYYVYAKEPLGKILGVGGGESVDTYATYLTAENISLQLNTGMFVYLVAQLYGIKDNYNNEGNFIGIEVVKDDTIINLLEDPRIIKVVASRYLPKGIVWNNSDNKFVCQANGGVTAKLCNYDKYDASYQFNKLLKIEFFESDYAKEYLIDDNIPTPILNIENQKNIDYEPKLLTAPYSQLRLNIYNKFSNLKRENFSNGIKLKLAQGLINSTNLRVQPLDYLNENNGLFSQIKADIDSQINLRTDAWLEYEANNSASINGGLVVAGAQVAGGLALGALTGGIGLAVAGSQVLNFAGQIANELIRRKDIKNTPDEVKQAPNDSFTPVLLNNMLVNVEFIEIKPYYKNLVFNYLYHFGYKCNDFKKPNLRSRYYFNYIKTIGVNINTGIDADFRNELVGIYDKGITIFHYRDGQTFKGINNYNYENVEMNLMGG